MYQEFNTIVAQKKVKNSLDLFTLMCLGYICEQLGYIRTSVDI